MPLQTMVMSSIHLFMPPSWLHSGVIGRIFATYTVYGIVVTVYGIVVYGIVVSFWAAVHAHNRGGSRIFFARGGKGEGRLLSWFGRLLSWFGRGYEILCVKEEDVSGVWGEGPAAFYCYHVTSARFRCIYIISAM